jgi:hypothetical protein
MHHATYLLIIGALLFVAYDADARLEVQYGRTAEWRTVAEKLAPAALACHLARED